MQGKNNEQCDNNNRIGKEATNCIVATYKINKTKNKELTTNAKQNKAIFLYKSVLIVSRSPSINMKMG
jgi:hypothetical protein